MESISSHMFSSPVPSMIAPNSPVHTTITKLSLPHWSPRSIRSDIFEGTTMKQNTPESHIPILPELSSELNRDSLKVRYDILSSEIISATHSPVADREEYLLYPINSEFQPVSTTPDTIGEEAVNYCTAMINGYNNNFNNYGHSIHHPKKNHNGNINGNANGNMNGNISGNINGNINGNDDSNNNNNNNKRLFKNWPAKHKMDEIQNHSVWPSAAMPYNKKYRKEIPIPNYDHQKSDPNSLHCYQSNEVLVEPTSNIQYQQGLTRTDCSNYVHITNTKSPHNLNHNGETILNQPQSKEFLWLAGIESANKETEKNRTIPTRKLSDMELFAVLAASTNVGTQCSECNQNVGGNLIQCTQYLQCKRCYCESCALKIDSLANVIMKAQTEIRKSTSISRQLLQDGVFYCPYCR